MLWRRFRESHDDINTVGRSETDPTRDRVLNVGGVRTSGCGQSWSSRCVSDGGGGGGGRGTDGEDVGVRDREEVVGGG